MPVWNKRGHKHAVQGHVWRDGQLPHVGLAIQSLEESPTKCNKSRRALRSTQRVPRA